MSWKHASTLFAATLVVWAVVCLTGAAPLHASTTATQEAAAEALGEEAFLREFLTYALTPSMTAQLDASDQQAVSNAESAYYGDLDTAALHASAVVNDPTMAETQAVQSVNSAEQALDDARNELRAIALVFEPHIYPADPVYILPRYIVPRSALAHAIWRTNSSLPPTTTDPNLTAIQNDLLDSVDAQPMAMGRLQHVDAIELTDFVVVDDLLALTDGVYQASDVEIMWGATAVFQNTQLLHQGMIYDQNVQLDFIPSLLSVDHGTRWGFNDHLEGFGPFDPTEGPEEIACEVCSAGGTCAGCSWGCGVGQLQRDIDPIDQVLRAGEMYDLIAGMALCPDFYRGPMLDPAGLVLEMSGEQLLTLEGGFATASIMAGLTSELDSFGDIDGCGDGEPFPGPVPGFGGGATGGASCSGKCNPMNCPEKSINTEPPDYPKHVDGFQGGDECGLAVLGKYFPHEDCMIDDSCDPRIAAWTASYARFGNIPDPGGNHPFKPDVLPKGCLLAAMGGGGINPDCKVGGSARLDVNWGADTTCLTDPLACPAPGGVRMTFCVSGAAGGQQSCVACDAFGHCHPVESTSWFSDEGGGGSRCGAGLEDSEGNVTGNVLCEWECEDGTDACSMTSECGCAYANGGPNCDPEHYDEMCGGGGGGGGDDDLGDVGNDGTEGNQCSDDHCPDEADGGTGYPPDVEDDPLAGLNEQGMSNNGNLSDTECGVNGCTPGKGGDAGKPGVSSSGPATGGDPVSLLSGTLDLRKRDLKGPPSMMPLELVRSYRSNDHHVSHLGRNWTQAFGERLIHIDSNHTDYTFPLWCKELQPLTTCLYHDRGDGTGELYMWDTSRNGGDPFVPHRDGTVFVPATGKGGVVRQTDLVTPEGWFWRYTLLDESGMTTEFDHLGRVLRKQDHAGNQVLFEYNADGLLDRVLDDRGQGFAFTYGLWDLLIGVEEISSTPGGGQRVEYCYDIAVRPRSGTWRDDQLLSAELQLNEVQGCYRITDAMFARDHLAAVIQCSKSDPGMVATCLSTIYDPKDEELPPLLEIDAPDAVKRSMAFLTNVRVVPAASQQPYWAPTSLCTVDDDVMETRYTYTDVPNRVEFQVDYQTKRPSYFIRKDIPTGMGKDGQCVESEPDMAVLVARRDFDVLRGNLIREERRLNARELTDGGQPTLASSALICDASCSGQVWQVELETQYQWDASRDDFGRVASQRYGSDVDHAAAAVCQAPPGPGTGLVDAMWSSLPEFEFEYHNLSGFWSHPAAAVVGAAAQVLAADGEPFASLSYTMKRSPYNDPLEEYPPFEVDSCRAVSLQYPLFANDVMNGLSPDPDVITHLDRRRDERDLAARQVCQIVTTYDRGDHMSVAALNHQGRPLIEYVDGGTDEPFVRVNRFNGDGQLIETIAQPVMDQNGALVGGRRALYERERLRTDPRARGNILTHTIYADPDATNQTLPSGATVDDAPASVKIEYLYEPLTNQIREQLVWGSGPNRRTRYYFEYEESAQARAEIVDLLDWYGLARNFTWTVDADVNNDGVVTSARPLPVRVEYPTHSASGGTPTNWVNYTYDGYGALRTIVDSAGNTQVLHYAERFGPDAVDLSLVNVPPTLLTNLTGPTRNDATHGGPLQSVVTTTVNNVTAADFSMPPTVTHTTSFLHAAAGRRVSHVHHGDAGGSVTAYEYDGHHRMTTVTNPDGLISTVEYDGDGKPVRQIHTDGFTEQAATHIYRNPDGSVAAVARSLVPTHATRRSLSSLTSERDSASTTLWLLDTVARDGEGRPIELISPERRATAIAYHPWAGVREMLVTDAAGTVAQHVSTEFDGYGQPVERNVVGGTQSLTATSVFDGLGRLVGAQGPDGLAVTRELNANGDLVSTKTWDNQGTVQVEQAFTLGVAGEVLASTVSYNNDLALSPPVMSTLSSTIVRDDQGRPTCIGSEVGFEQRLYYASDAVAKREVYNVEQGVPCDSAAQTTLLSTDLSYASYPAGTALTEHRQGAGVQSIVVTTDSTLDWAGRPTDVTTTRAGEVATAFHGYDVLGRYIGHRDAWGTGTILEWDAVGRLDSEFQHRTRGVSDLNDLFTDYVYDGDGLLVQLDDPTLGTSTWSYDGAGRPLTATLPGPDGSPLVRTFLYDDLGRLRTATEGSAVTTWGYLPGSTLMTSINSTDGVSPITTTVDSYDVMNNVTGTTRYGQIEDVTTTQGFDALGRIRSDAFWFSDGRSYTTLLDHEAEGRLNHVLSFGNAEYGVNDVELEVGYNGVLSHRMMGHITDPWTSSMSSPYLLEIEHVGAIPTRHVITHDDVDALNASESWLSTTRLLDAAGRPTDLFWQGLDDQVMLGLDSAFYAKDDRLFGRVRSWTEQDGTPRQGQLRLVSYDGVGRVAGVQEHTSFDPNEIDDWYNTLGDSNYRADLAGADATTFGATTQADFGGLWKSFGRTKLGTLGTEHWDGTDIHGTSYSNDLVWNAQEIGERAMVELQSPMFANTDQSVTWNDRGMMLSTTNSTMTWSADDHLTRVDRDVHSSLSGTEEYVYDGLGRLVRTIRGNRTVDRVYVGDSVLREVSGCIDRVWWPTGALDGPGAYSIDVLDGCLPLLDPDISTQDLIDTCSPGDPAPVDAEWLVACEDFIDPDGLEGVWHDLDLMDMTEGTLWHALARDGRPREGAMFVGVLQDLHHDVVGIVDTDLQLLETYDYGIHGDRELRDIEGNLLCASTTAEPCASSWGNSRGYTGRFLSSATGLYDHRARQYDPHLRLWTAPDPLGYIDAFELWSYVDGDPVNRLDPTGLDPWGYAPLPSEDPPPNSGSAGSFLIGVAKYVAVEYVRAAIVAYPSYNSGYTGEQYTRDVITPALDESNVSHSSRDVKAGYDAGPYVLLALNLAAAGLTPQALSGAARGVRKLGSALDDLRGAARASSALSGGARSAAAQASKSACFIAGTQVATERGPLPIEEVRVGDRVLSRDDVTGEVSYQPVVDTFVRHDVPTLELTFEGAGATERVVTTGEHPFWVVDRGWVEARELRPGDALFSSTGGWLRVGSATWTGHTATVYNFEVAGTHTYFVGDAAVWVHNSCFNHLEKAPKWTSRPNWGHTFTKHGKGKKITKSLRDRARTEGNQGQWLDNEAAAQHLYDEVKRLDITEVTDIEIPPGLGQVIRPDGSIDSTTRARIVPFGSGTGVRTAFPICDK